MTRTRLILFFILHSSFSFAQTHNIDSLISAHKNDFITPLNTPITMSGAFLEPRPGAYHMGVDFPAPMGTPVHAAADGYVWRLRISPYGYGRAVYIKHKNGLLTVYGHFSKFNDNLTGYLTRYQYAHQLNEVDIYPDSLLHTHIDVKQGDIIGYVGNAGQSQAPHLHFEIREAQGETFPLNPLLFSHFGLNDTRPPTIYDISFYERSKLVCNIMAPAQHQVILIHSTKVWLGVTATDFDNAGHPFGIYGYDMVVDGKTIFKLEKKRLDFAYLGNTEAQIDYREKQQYNMLIYRLFKLPNDESTDEDGVITFKPNQKHDVVIEVYDAFNNKSTLSITLKAAPILTQPIEYKQVDSAYTWKGSNTIIQFPVHCSYVSAHPVVVEKDNKVTIYDRYPVAQKKCTIKVFNQPLTAYQLKKAVMFLGTKCSPQILNGDTLTGYGSIFEDLDYKGMDGYSPQRYLYPTGRPYIEVDTVAPEVSEFNGKSKEKISWSISDMSSGIENYNIYIDNVWHPCYYDAKSALVVCNVKQLNTGKHNVQIVVTDKVQNTTTKNFVYFNDVIKH